MMSTDPAYSLTHSVIQVAATTPVVHSDAVHPFGSLRFADLLADQACLCSPYFVRQTCTLTAQLCHVAN